MFLNSFPFMFWHATTNPFCHKSPKTFVLPQSCHFIVPFVSSFILLICILSSLLYSNHYFTLSFISILARPKNSQTNEFSNNNGNIITIYTPILIQPLSKPFAKTILCLKKCVEYFSYFLFLMFPHNIHICQCKIFI